MASSTTTFLFSSTSEATDRLNMTDNYFSSTIEIAADTSSILNVKRQLTPSEETELLVLKVLSTSMAVAFPIGLIINIIALIVLNKAKTKSGTEVIIIGLTFVDLLSNASGIWTNMIIMLSYYTDFGEHPFIKANFKYILRADIIVYMASFTISTTLSLERVFAVYKPMDFRKIWTTKFNFLLISIGSIITIALFVAIVVFISENAFLVLRCVFTVVILTIVIISNILTLAGLKLRISRISSYVENTQKDNLYLKERRQTKILVGISTIFIFCGITNSAVAWAAFLDSGDFQLSAYLAFIFGYIRWIFQVVYSILNSSIFVLTNRTYRKRLKRLFYHSENSDSAGPTRAMTGNTAQIEISQISDTIGTFKTLY